MKAVEKKLSVDPEGYGRPLRGPLAGYWKLRVDDYRVIYRIVRDRIEVLVVMVGIRRDFEVYRQMLHRIDKL